MRRHGTRRLWGHAAAVIAGVAAGSLVALLVASAVTQGRERAVGPPVVSDDRASKMAPPPQPEGSSPARNAPRLLLAWASGGLPSDTENMLQGLPEVRRVTTVVTGVDWLAETRSVDGARTQSAPKGLAVPLDVAAVDPRGYSAFVPPAERAIVAALGAGEAVLSETSAELRSTRGEEATLALTDREVTVVGTISDVAANGYEALIAGPAPASWTRPNRFVLIHLRRAHDRPRVTRKIDRLLGPGQTLRVRARGETPFLRYGDAVLPQLLIKDTFGEFAARPLPDGRLEIDPAWRTKNIVTVAVPVLGDVTCHRTLVPQLRAALRQVAQEGLGFTINRRQYGGCYGPRFIGLDPEGRLSHHSWGIAIDINVAENAFGTKADQDARLVEIFEDHGFTWGGRWLVPDGMHFEWVAFP